MNELNGSNVYGESLYGGGGLIGQAGSPYVLVPASALGYGVSNQPTLAAASSPQGIKPEPILITPPVAAATTQPVVATAAAPAPAPAPTPGGGLGDLIGGLFKVAVPIFTQLFSTGVQLFSSLISGFAKAGG